MSYPVCDSLAVVLSGAIVILQDIGTKGDGSVSAMVDALSLVQHAERRLVELLTKGCLDERLPSREQERLNALLRMPAGKPVATPVRINGSTRQTRGPDGRFGPRITPPSPTRAGVSSCPVQLTFGFLHDPQ